MQDSSQLRICPPIHHLLSTIGLLDRMRNHFRLYWSIGFIVERGTICFDLEAFPGYGDNADSHTDLVYDNRSLEELRANDFLPFKAGIEAGADSIMVSHNIVPAIDNVPSSISPEINKILRNELGFEGVIMTDDFDMQGLVQFVDQDTGALQTIQAGTDMILSSSYASQIPYIIEQVKAGTITEERIDQSVKRILGMKYDLGLINKQRKGVLRHFLSYFYSKISLVLIPSTSTKAALLSSL